MAQEVQKSSWQYHPLSGNELLKWIFADAWQKLVNDGQFGAHLVYHNPSYRVKLEVQAFDASARGATNGAMVEAVGHVETTKDDLGDKKPIKFVMDLESEPLREPDKARELLDEGRYKVVTKDGVLVDEKVKKNDKKEPKQ